MLQSCAQLQPHLSSQLVQAQHALENDSQQHQKQNAASCDSKRVKSWRKVQPAGLKRADSLPHGQLICLRHAAALQYGAHCS